jgi:hypothetical protein
MNIKIDNNSTNFYAEKSVPSTEEWGQETRSQTSAQQETMLA